MKMDCKSKTPKYWYQTCNEKRPDDTSGLQPQTKTLDMQHGGRNMEHLISKHSEFNQNQKNHKLYL